MNTQTGEPRLLPDATHALIQQVTEARAGASDDFDAARRIMPYLGAHYRNHRVEVGFWVPEAAEAGADAVYLEVLRAQHIIDVQADEQTLRFTRWKVELVADGDYYFGVIDGMQAGTRDSFGDFYRPFFYEADGTRHYSTDYLAHSIPFGAFAPAELYDMETLQAERADRAYFQNLDVDPAHGIDDVPRVAAPTNILQIHARYATEDRTLGGLARFYNHLAVKVVQGEPLTPFEQTFTGYDAIQLMPIEPTIEYEAGPPFWQPQDESDYGAVDMVLRRPDMTNWGYDVVLAASSATNPALLESKRPDELADLIAVLHNFPGKPIKVVLDIVYGHADNQALDLLNRYFFSGPNMYGQGVDFQQPVVRAMLLEMMRRKHNFGVDGIRVDGAQDFRNYDPATDTMVHDDDYLRLMNDVVLDVAGVRYLPWMIFEDGRPWPREDWELASSYREVTRQMPNVWQWGPLTFAHNTPFLFTFWMTKWWRVREMAEMGREWITGCANHDTVRRGEQVPTDARVNSYLGDTLPEIITNGYDNPAARLFDYCMMPGIPMDFINATTRAPWAFIRNTDERYGVKVAAEEARFTVWRVTDDLFNRSDAFTRMKSFGITSREALQAFMFALERAVLLTDYDLDSMAELLGNGYASGVHLENLTAEKLKAMARGWMDDLHNVCNVSHYADNLLPESTEFHLAVREFRRARPWLMDNLRDDEHLAYRHPAAGTALYYGLRRAPDGNEAVLFIANMEGEPAQVIPRDLPIPDLPQDSWTVAVTTPGLDVPGFESALSLADSQGVVFRRVGAR